MPASTVSIGLPVYNGARTLRSAVDSVLGQTWTDFELIISDNASTDATEQICREYAQRDPRVRYLRQPVNLGGAANFKAVLDASTGEFFMWAAADDTRSADFLEVNLAFLRSHPDYVASCSPVRFEGRGFDPVRMGDAPLDGCLPERVFRTLRGIHANGRFYSLLRRTAIASCPLVGEHFLASDWALVLHLAAQGKMHRCTEGWTVLGTGGVSWSREIFRMHRRSWLDFWAPYRTFARIAWQHGGQFGSLQRLRLAMTLLGLNVYGFLSQGLVALRRK